MAKSKIPGRWQAKQNGGTWQVLDSDGKLVATLADIPDAKEKAKFMAASLYMRDALRAVGTLIGDEDLPDNGELSGAAVCDMVRAAIQLSK